MKKIIIADVLLVAVLAALMVCLLHTESYREDVTAQDIETAISVYVGEQTFTASEGTALNAKRCFGINTNDYADVVYYTPSITMDVNEILWVKAADEAEAAELVTAMNERLTSQKTAFDGYGEDQMALLNKAYVFQTGRYAVYIVANHADDIKAAMMAVMEE